LFLQLGRYSDLEQFMFYDETIKFRAERGLAAAMAAAARKDRTRSSEWARRALRKGRDRERRDAAAC
jgi:hypothetical protein